MLGAAFTPLDWLAVVHRELLLFSCLFFALGSLDEFAIDILYLVGRLSGRIQTPVIDRQTGIFSGKAWSTTCGWINLGSTSAPLLQATTKAITLPAPNARYFFRVGAPRLGP